MVYLELMASAEQPDAASSMTEYAVSNRSHQRVAVEVQRVDFSNVL